MSENFGLKIGLEGEREFKKSLAEINTVITDAAGGQFSAKRHLHYK